MAIANLINSLSRYTCKIDGKCVKLGRTRELPNLALLNQPKAAEYLIFQGITDKSRLRSGFRDISLRVRTPDTAMPGVGEGFNIGLPVPWVRLEVTLYKKGA